MLFQSCNGNQPAFGEDLGRFFVIYFEIIDARTSNHALEKTCFPETLHASLDVPFAGSKQWKDAQRADADAITRYAAENLDGEDLAESALFAYAYVVTPGRLPQRVTSEIENRMPARLAVLRNLFDGPRFQQIKPASGC